MIETSPESLSISPDYRPPPRSWSARNFDWLMGSGVTLLLLTLFSLMVFLSRHELMSGNPTTVPSLGWFFLYVFLQLSFLWCLLAGASVYGFTINPRRRRQNPFSSAIVLIEDGEQQTTIGAYRLDGMIGPFMLAAFTGWPLCYAAMLAIGVDLEDASSIREPAPITLLLLVCMGYVMWLLFIGFLLTPRDPNRNRAIRIDRRKQTLVPASRSFSRETPEPIDIADLRAIRAERWSPKVKPDGEPAFGSPSLISVTAELVDPKINRRVHLLSTADNERLAHWLAAYLGVPFKQREFQYGPHRSFRVSKPLPNDIDG